MKTLTISSQDALKIYPAATAELKTMLETTFGKEFFLQEIMGRIKTFEDACAELKLNAKEVFSAMDSIDEVAYKKLKVIVRALNEGWKPDWNNKSESKWRPWFYLNAFDSRLYDSDSDGTGTTIGSRLCYRTEELCTYAAHQFKDIYLDFLKQ